MANELYVQKIVNDKVYYTNGVTGKTVYSKIITKSPVIKHRGREYKFNRETNTIDLTDLIQTDGLSPLTNASEFSINQRFTFLEKFTSMVISNVTASLLVCGQSGLGKSHTIMALIEAQKLVEDTDYVVIKGYSTPKALYATLYEHKNKLIIFDDCDSVLMDPTSLNILKGALDSYQKRTISWLSKGFIDDGLPASFDFEGQVIFISNRPLEKIDGAVKGRTISVDLTMTIQDRIDRMTAIIKDILPQYSLVIKQEVLDFIDEHKYEAVELNLRTFEKLIKVHASYEADPMWKQAAKYLLVQS